MPAEGISMTMVHVLKLANTVKILTYLMDNANHATLDLSWKKESAINKNNQMAVFNILRIQNAFDVRKENI